MRMSLVCHLALHHNKVNKNICFCIQDVSFSIAGQTNVGCSAIALGHRTLRTSSTTGTIQDSVSRARGLTHIV